jgi:hypothetical protein
MTYFHLPDGFGRCATASSNTLKTQILKTLGQGLVLLISF